MGTCNLSGLGVLGIGKLLYMFLYILHGCLVPDLKICRNAEL